MTLFLGLAACNALQGAESSEPDSDQKSVCRPDFSLTHLVTFFIKQNFSSEALEKACLILPSDIRNNFNKLIDFEEFHNFDKNTLLEEDIQELLGDPLLLNYILLYGQETSAYFYALVYLALTYDQAPSNSEKGLAIQTNSHVQLFRRALAELTEKQKRHYQAITNIYEKTYALAPVILKILAWLVHTQLDCSLIEHYYPVQFKKFKGYPEQFKNPRDIVKHYLATSSLKTQEAAQALDYSENFKNYFSVPVKLVRLINRFNILHAMLKKSNTTEFNLLATSTTGFNVLAISDFLLMQAVVELLSSYHPRYKNKKLASFMHQAAYAGNNLTIDYFLKRGFTADGESNLHWAAFGGHSDTVRYLIAHGAQVNAEFHNHTPLDYAARHKHRSVMNVLLQHRAQLSSQNAEQARKYKHEKLAQEIETYLQSGDLSITPQF